MTIQLSPTLEKRVAREAKARGIKPKDLVEKALKAYLKPPTKTRPQESEARRRLRELNKFKRKVVDFDATVREAKAAASKLYEDNTAFITMASTRYSKSAGVKSK